MKSKFKHLVVSGCSFSSDDWISTTSEMKQWNWPNVLTKEMGAELHNLSNAAAGNEYIANSIILYLEEKKLDPKDTLIFPMWSGIGRFGWLLDPKSITNVTKNQQYINKNVKIYHTAVLREYGGEEIDKVAREYSKYQNDYTVAIKSWLAMNNLLNYSIANGFTYFCTSFFNYHNQKNLKYDVLSKTFDTRLLELGLKIDQSCWIPISQFDYLGDWAHENNLLMDDKFHPSIIGAQQWTTNVLIPTMRNLHLL